MKRITKLCSLLAVIVFANSCGPSKTEETVTSEEVEVMEEAQEEKASEITSIINPNLASVEELTDIGLPSEVVTKIVDFRPFLNMSDLDGLFAETMDSTQRATLYSKLFVPFNLNTTPEDDFKLIPGVGNRMAHEFEEYRPYSNIIQFRKEIGKYVDEEEVARYEQYVFVPVELNTASKEEILAIPGVGERMLHEFEEYRPYSSMEQFRKEIGKYVDEKEIARLERFVYIETPKN